MTEVNLTGRGCIMSKKFKAFCAERNIKQAEIADVLGVTRSTANLKINGKLPFTLTQIKKLCETYGISADIFIA